MKAHIQKKLEDVTVVRDRIWHRYLSEAIPIQLVKLYTRYAPGLFEDIKRDIQNLSPVEQTRISPNILQWAWYLEEEAFIAPEYEAYLNLMLKSRPAPSHAIHALFKNPSPRTVSELAQALDKSNPERIRWFKLWKSYARSRHRNDTLFLRHGISLSQWQQRLSNWLEMIHDEEQQYLTPAHIHMARWSDWFPPENVREMLTNTFTGKSRELLSFIWQEIMELPADGNLDIIWEHQHPERIAHPRCVFDGNFYHLYAPGFGTWHEVFDVFYLWGFTILPFFLPVDCPWTVIYGIDPGVRYGWGFWCMQMFFRPWFPRVLDISPSWNTIFHDSIKGWFWFLHTWLAGTALSNLKAIRSQSISDEFLAEARQNLAHHIMAPIEPEILLPWIINRGTTLHLFRGWFFATALHVFLEEMYGIFWWKNKETRFFLLDLWEYGSSTSIEILLKEIGMLHWPDS